MEYRSAVRVPSISVVSPTARLFVAFGVVALLASAGMVVSHASREAVRSQAALLSHDTLYVMLPTVEIVGQREPSTAADSSPIAADTGAIPG